MKLIIGMLLMVVGALFAAYVGVWICFVGGIVQVIESINAAPVDAMGIAIGAVKVVFVGPITGITFAIALVPGYAMVNS